MVRSVFACVVLCILAGMAAAAEPPAYSVVAQASRSDGKIVVSLKILQNKEEVVPKVGLTKVTTTLSAPRLLLDEGQQAIMESGESVPTAKDPHPADVTSGFKVEIISAKGQDNVVMVTLVMEKGAIVWAEGRNVAIEPAAGDGK